MQTPNVLGLLFGLAQMVLYVVYKNPKKNSAVSEAAAAQQVEVKDQQQLQMQLQASPAVAPLDVDADADADLEAAAPATPQRPADDDAIDHRSVVVDIPPPPQTPPALPAVEVA